MFRLGEDFDRRFPDLLRAVTLDEVTHLGLYLEIEMLVAQEQWQVAREQIIAIATDWRIMHLREPRSYLRMLLETTYRGPEQDLGD